jgi:hypothetical protein
MGERYRERAILCNAALILLPLPQRDSKTGLAKFYGMAIL